MSVLLKQRNSNIGATVVFLTTLLAVLGLVSLTMGAGSITVSDALAFLTRDSTALKNDHLGMVIKSLRFPRLVAAVLVGAGLGVAGTLLQTITRNPLAESGLLGINSGAALAIVVGITYFEAASGYEWLAWSFSGSLVGCGLVLLISRAKGKNMTPVRLVLAGIALGASFRGISSYILISHQLSYDQYRFWVLGSLAGVDPDRIFEITPAVILGLILALMLSRPVSALMLGDDTARNLGYYPGLIRIFCIGSVTLLAGSAVALTGPIGFLGLMAPHAARAFTGPRVFPAILLSGFFGAIFLLGADMAARVVIKPFETPASVLISLMGSPLLIYLAWRKVPIESSAGGHGE